jgi:hypothetical protein
MDEHLVMGPANTLRSDPARRRDGTEVLLYGPVIAAHQHRERRHEMLWHPLDLAARRSYIWCRAGIVVAFGTATIL